MSKLFTAILVLVIGVVAGLMIDKTALLSTLRIPFLTATPTPAPLTIPTPTPNPMSDWKTYSNASISFQYPSSWYVQERVPGFFVIVNPSDAHIATAGISIDTRYTESYDMVVQNHKANLVNIQEFPLSNGVKITGTVSDAVPGGGVHIIDVILKQGSSAVAIETSSPGSDTKNFDHVVSTFRLTEQTTASLQCGGIMGKICPEGYTCKLNGNYPDAGGKCIENRNTKAGYTCPASGWVDCMPGTEPKPECSDAAMTWYKTNCPNFQGGAL